MTTQQATGQSYEALVAEATAAATRGWDFAFLAGRSESEPLPWDYPELVRPLLRSTLDDGGTVLDIDTGGGEMLASLLPPYVGPGTVVAVEPYPPNLPVARERLELLGVDVRFRDARLPVADGWAAVVLNRHGAIDPGETARVLAAGGEFITQQVDADNQAELNALLGAPPPPSAPSVAEVADQLRAAGLEILDCVTAAPAVRFCDIGAVVFQLRMVSWQIPDFTPERYEDALRALDARIRRDGGVVVHDRRALVRARRPR